MEEKQALEHSVAELLQRLEKKPQLYAVNEDTLGRLAADKVKFESARPHFRVQPSYITSGVPWLEDSIVNQGILVKVLVNAEGDVVDARLPEREPSSPPIPNEIAAAIIDFVKEVKFSPATIDGKPTVVWTDYKFGGPQM